MQKDYRIEPPQATVEENMADLMKEIYHGTISSHDAKMLYMQYMDEYELLSEKEEFL